VGRDQRMTALDASGEGVRQHVGPNGHRGLIHRVLDVLDAFSRARPTLTLTGISRRTDLPLATVHRLVGELVQWGALDRSDGGSYSLGLRLWLLSAATPRTEEFREVALPFLVDLYRSTGAQTRLSILDGTSEVVIASIARRGHHGHPGGRTGDHATSAGQLLLAHAPGTSRTRSCPAAPTPRPVVRGRAPRCGAGSRRSAAPVSQSARASRIRAWSAWHVRFAARPPRSWPPCR
jgi:DNA-binding IclR family transcriptional regulator